MAFSSYPAYDGIPVDSIPFQTSGGTGFFCIKNSVAAACNFFVTDQEYMVRYKLNKKIKPCSGS